jgi:ABC-type branched-subunit amino acid transport system ATPase component
MMILRPAGLIPEGSFRRVKKTKPRVVSSVNTQDWPGIQFGKFTNKRTQSAQEDVDDVLTITDIRKSFGGLSAVGGASFSLKKGQITALIGPNGAGKTTIFNMVTGTLGCDSGSVTLNGRELTGMKPYEVERLGIARSFQDVRLNDNMTVLDNVAVAVPNQPGEKVSGLILHPIMSRKAENAVENIALECLTVLGVADSANQLVKDLSYGDQKLVAIARLLATDCDVLLLDEPTSGVDPGSVNLVIEGVSKLRDLGKTVCLVEHSVHFVERLADHAVFLDQGVVIAQGTVAELVSSDELTELYFGN